MAHPNAPSLRARLAGLVAAAMLPAALLAILLGVRERHRDRREAEAQVLRLAHTLAARQGRLLDGTERLLRGIARVPAVRAGGTACSAFMRELLPAFPDYTNLGTQQADGRVTCNAVAPDDVLQPRRAVDVARVRAAGGFVVGEYEWGAHVRRPVLVTRLSTAGVLTEGPAGNDPALVFASLDLSWLERGIREAGLPAGATVGIFGPSGEVSVRFPDPARFGGVRVPYFERLVRPIGARGTEAVGEAAGDDGVERLYGVVRLGRDGGRGEFLSVGVPSATLASAIRDEAPDFAWLSALLGAALVVAWLAGDRLLLRPSRQIADACARLGRGDLQARTGLPHTRSEVGRIAASFDRMADSLERRSLEVDRTLDALAASEGRLRTLAEYAPVGVILSDGRGNIVWVNARCAEITGRPVEGLLGPEWAALVHPDDLTELVRGVEELRRGERPFLFGEYRVRRPDGSERWVESRTVPVWTALGPDDQGRTLTGMVGVMEDVTERREEEARQRQAQRLEAVGRLAGGVAHDFNNLLMVVGGNAELALEDVRREGRGDGDPLVEVLGEIHTAARRGADVTRQLLAFSRQQVLRPRPLYLSAVVRDGMRLLQRLAGEDVQLDVQLADPAGPVLADPTQLDQVLFNLVLNARDAVRAAPAGVAAGGGTDLGAEGEAGDERSSVAAHLPAPAPRIVVATRVEEVTRAIEGAPPAGPSGGPPPGRYAVLAVSDNGPGMDEATRARVFEPFFTTKAVGAGTGLGLATVYGVVAQSGGYATVTSDPGEGATFTVYLPLLSEAVAHELTASANGGAGGAIDTSGALANGSPRSPRSAAATAGGVPTVLLAEDDSAVRALLCRALERSGMRVLEAADGAAAWARWEAEGGAVDAVVSDVVMPGLGGPALCARIRQSRPGVPVLLMSGYADVERARAGRDVRAAGDVAAPDAWLDKPVSGDALAARVWQVLAARPVAARAGAGT